MKKSLLFILGLVLIIITSCNYNTIEPVVIELPDDPIVFSTQIEPVFQDKCITCHSSMNPILTTGNAYNSLINGGYVDIDNPTSSTIYIKVNSGHQGGFTATELAYLLKWIQEGAENN